MLWVVVLALAGGGGWTLTKQRERPPIEVRTHRVEPGSVRDLVSSSSTGRVAAVREVTLRAEVAGVLAAIRRQRGDKVAAGDVLLAFDADDLRDRLRLAQAQTALGRAQVAQAQASEKIAARNAERARQLLASGAVPQAEAETLAGQLDVASHAAEAARAGWAQSSASAELARNALSKALVKAPFAGIVVATHGEVGETVVPGAPLVELADLSTLHADGELDEADAARVAVGQPAELSLDALPGERLQGLVSEVAPSVTRDARGARSLAFKVSLPADRRLRLGMSADIDVVVARREGVLWVPPMAVAGRGERRSVFVVEGAVARKRTIEAGITTWEAVEVARGLTAGEQVILTTTGLSDGARVRPVAPTPEPGPRLGALP